MFNGEIWKVFQPGIENKETNNIVSICIQHSQEVRANVVKKKQNKSYKMEKKK